MIPFQIGSEKLGSGSYGDVYSGIYTDLDNSVKQCAIKITKSKGSVSGFANLNEIEILTKLGTSSDRIARLYNLHIDEYSEERFNNLKKTCPDYVKMILELADFTGLSLFKNETYNFDCYRKLAKDLLLGLAYMHEKRICHRDLKSENLLIFRRGDEFRLKITDFGLSTILPYKGDRHEEIQTLWYKAPEIKFQVNDYKITSDNWCAGIILIELFTGSYFFSKVGLEPSLSKYMEFCIDNIADEWTLNLQEEYRNNSENKSVKIFGSTEKRRFTSRSPTNYIPYLSSKNKVNATAREISLTSAFLKNFLTFDYKNRWRIEDILRDNSFFNESDEIIEEISKFKIPRQWNIIFFEIPKEINDKKVEYFSEAIERLDCMKMRHFFHAVDIVNRFITKFPGIEIEINDIFACSIYISHKMFNISSRPRPAYHIFYHYWDQHCKVSQSDKLKIDRVVYEFEHMLISNYESFGYIIQATIYDMQNCYKEHMENSEAHILSYGQIKELFIHFCNLEKTRKKSYRKIYREMYKELFDKDFIV